jgi:hypothetical protein
MTAALPNTILKPNTSSACMSQWEAAQPPTATAQPEPYLVPLQPQVGIDRTRTVVLTKCRCNCSWCQECFKARGAKTISKRMQEMDGRYVRHLMLSVDRDQYPSGEAAYEAITKGGYIRGMLRNLKRILGRNIKRWIWILEWHQDGYPHWHVIVEMQERGKAGMIGYEAIHQYWGQGIVRESYIRNKRHWKQIAGYFGKSGYFESSKAEYQTGLPEWAQDWVTTIRRFGCSVGKWKDSGKGGGSGPEVSEDEKLKSDRRSYSMILAGCGKKTRIRLFDHKGNLRNCWEADVLIKEAISELRHVPRSLSKIEKDHNGEIVSAACAWSLVIARWCSGFEYAEGIGYLMNCDADGLCQVMAYFRDHGLRRAATGEKMLYAAACN